MCERDVRLAGRRGRVLREYRAKGKKKKLLPASSHGKLGSEARRRGCPLGLTGASPEGSRRRDPGPDGVPGLQTSLAKRRRQILIFF